MNEDAIEQLCLQWLAKLGFGHIAKMSGMIPNGRHMAKRFKIFTTSQMLDTLPVE